MDDSDRFVPFWLAMVLNRLQVCSRFWFPVLDFVGCPVYGLCLFLVLGGFWPVKIYSYVYGRSLWKYTRMCRLTPLGGVWSRSLEIIRRVYGACFCTQS